MECLDYTIFVQLQFRVSYLVNHSSKRFSSLLVRRSFYTLHKNRRPYVYAVGREGVLLNWSKYRKTSNNVTEYAVNIRQFVITPALVNAIIISFKLNKDIILYRH